MASSHKGSILINTRSEQLSVEYAVYKTLWRMPEEFKNRLTTRFLGRMLVLDFFSRINEDHPQVDFLEHQNQLWEICYHETSHDTLWFGAKDTDQVLISFRYRATPTLRIALVTKYSEDMKSYKLTKVL